MAKSRTRSSIDFTREFPNSDVIFLVEGEEIHCMSSILCMASPVFQKVTEKAKQAKITNLGNTLTIDLEDAGIKVKPSEFKDLMVILHTTGKTPDILKSRDGITRMLPVLKLFYLHDTIVQCEEQLLALPRHLNDFLLSEQYKMDELQKDTLLWAINQGHSELTNNPDWGVVREKFRLQIFEAISEKQEKEIERLTYERDMMDRRKQMYKDFVVDVDNVINGRTDESQRLTTMCKNAPEEYGMHMKGAERDCPSCRCFMISRIHNLFEIYRDRRPNDS